MRITTKLFLASSLADNLILSIIAFKQAKAWWIDDYASPAEGREVDFPEM